MKVRVPKSGEMDSIYLMGFDAWNGGEPANEYLVACRTSAKYQSGRWFCLETAAEPVSSLIVYQGCFGLEESCYGIGSVATVPAKRGNGYASFLIESIVETARQREMTGVFLFSEVGTLWYEQLGFRAAEGAGCSGAMYPAWIIHKATSKYWRNAMYTVPNYLLGTIFKIAVCLFDARRKSGVTSRSILLGTWRATFLGR